MHSHSGLSQLATALGLSGQMTAAPLTVYYKLVGKEVVPTTDPTDAVWDDPRRILENDTVGEGTEEVRVSTVFLPIDHNFGVGPPVVFETMIFGGKHNDYQERYTSYDAALERHHEIVQQLKDGSFEFTQRIEQALGGHYDELG